MEGQELMTTKLHIGLVEDVLGILREDYS